MANISISLEGIDQAISNLKYKPGSVKQKTILAIRAFYTSEDAVKQISSINMDELIKSIWNVGDTLSKIKSKRRNFSSIKSSINADLAKLSKKELNPENVTLTEANIFDMTEEAKSNLLSSFTDAVTTGDINLDQATNLLKAVSEFLENFEREEEETDSKDIVNQIKSILNKITDDVLSEDELASTPGLKKLKDGDLEFEDIEDDEELEEIDDLEDDFEEIEDDEDIEEIELDEDEEFEEVDDIDEDVEEIELDEDEELEEIDDLEDDFEEIEDDEDIEEIELDEDEEFEEVDDIDEDVEEIELDEDEELEEIDDLEDDFEEIEDDEDIEEIELDEDEEFEEVDDIDEDVEEIELDEDEELEEIDDLEDDFEEIEDDEDIEEVELDEDEEFEEVDDIDEDVEEIELDEDEEIEEIDDLEDDFEEIEDDEDIEEVELDEDEEFEEVDDIDEDVEEIELDEDEELEEIDDLEDDFEEVEDDEDIEEVELDEDEEFEEVDDIDEDVEEIELDEDEEIEEVDELDDEELKALEEFREKRELAEHFDETLGERERKYNKYVTVPEGEYTIGTKKSIKSSMELQQFNMPKVYIGVYPVTNSLFEIFIEQTGYITTAEKSGFGRVYSSRFKKGTNGSTWHKNAGSEDVEGACWHKPSGPGSTLHGKRNHPVVQVSVDDALSFASWIGRRIPTEAEFEAAARTDLGNKYPWGNEFDPKALNIEQGGLSDTSAVDEYDAFANEFKIVDMLGNVMEWTCDIESPPLNSKKYTKYCIAKGGAWNAKDGVTISSRALFKSGFTSNTIGFRCISEISI